MIVFGKSVDVFEKKGKIKSQQFKCLVRLYSQIDFFFPERYTLSNLVASIDDLLAIVLWCV